MQNPIAADGPVVIQWRDYYSVHDSTLDEQHQKVILMINWLYEVMWRGEDRTALPTLMRRLSDYTCTHFQTEEEVMRQAGYPGYPEHKEVHDKLAKDTAEMLFDSLHEEGPDTHDVLLFLKRWWINHITRDDKEYVFYLKENRRKSLELVEPESGFRLERELSELVHALVENEQRFRHYYEIMAECVPEYGETWEILQHQEGCHTAAMQRILQMVEESPSRFAVGKFSPKAARMMSRDIDDMIAKIEREEVHPRYAVSFARDIEQSLVEGHLADAIKTDVVEVTNVLQRLTSESTSHRLLIQSVDI